MVTITPSPSGEPAVGELLTLRDDEADSQVVIAPRRGALVTSFRVEGRELLYLDRSTLNDAQKNVRGGIPVLFPSPGKLDGDLWQVANRAGTMKQHGFGRNLPWTVVSTKADAGGAEVTLELESNETTRAQYPWDFRAQLRCNLRGARLRIAAEVKNESASVMPFALGYHPYFLVADKAHAAVEAHGTRAFDNVKKQEIPFAGFDLGAPELDLHLLDQDVPRSALRFGDESRIEVRGSAEFSVWIVWTLAGKDFVCLEPWTAPGNALNTGERLTRLEPGALWTSTVDLEFQRPAPG